MNGKFVFDYEYQDLWADYECRASPPDVTACGNPWELGEAYVYLLGLYLGDGCLSAAPRAVWRLRIFQDARYTGLIEDCVRVILSVSDRRAGLMRQEGCVEIYSNWKHWICLFPQHDVGPKHGRDMSLHAWQARLVAAHPRELLKGLIDSDGSRSINRVRRPLLEGVKEYRYVRYFFTNASPEIRALFTSTCALVGVDCRRMSERDISVARRESVLLLDQFIGPKH